MTEPLPSSTPILVIGAGVHGLSTAWHVARRGERVLLLDKMGVGSGASGIACGVIRNNYFQPAMQELMAACVEVWESDPERLHYHGTGYIALGPDAQEGDLTAVFERQQRIGYPSELYLGEAMSGPAGTRSTASRCSDSPTRRARPAPTSGRASR
jgi:glycine/D-amino acid oxidase-like deaminating enzyme